MPDKSTRLFPWSAYLIPCRVAIIIWYVQDGRRLSKESNKELSM